MSNPTYTHSVPREPKRVVWLHGQIKTPPFSETARVEAGLLLRRLQEGRLLEMPHSRPMPSIGAGCHELRVRDEHANWRIIYRIDSDAILVIDVFPKKSRKTPAETIEACKKRLADFDALVKERNKDFRRGQEKATGD